jgi:hypothetical protein
MGCGNAAGVLPGNDAVIGHNSIDHGAVGGHGFVCVCVSGSGLFPLQATYHPDPGQGQEPCIFLNILNKEGLLRIAQIFI